MYMTWYFVLLTWLMLSAFFYGAGVWLFHMQRRFFPLTWYEVSELMFIAVAVWQLAVFAFSRAIILWQTY